MNKSFENVTKFKYWETALTHQSSSEKEINRKLISGNACYHSGRDSVFPFAIQKLID
jgi:hypothetical protein